MHSQKVGANTISYTREGNGHPLLFLHGLGVHPRYYRALVNDLSHHFEVIAPAMFGVNRLAKQPTNIQEYGQLTADFAHYLKLGDYHLSGHSIGASISIAMGNYFPEQKKIVGINPLLPVDYSKNGFVARGMIKSGKELFGLSGVGFKGGVKAFGFALSFMPSFFWNTSRNYDALDSLINNLTFFNYSNWSLTHPILLIYGEGDEYFSLDEKNEGQLKKAFPGIKITRLPRFNHDWPLFRPEIAAREITDFLEPT